MNSKNDRNKVKDEDKNLFDWDKSKNSENNSNNLNLQKHESKKSISEEFLMEENWDSNEQIYKDEILKS